MLGSATRVGARAEDMDAGMSRTLMLTLAVGALVCALFLVAFPHRGDYLGHFAAGYGGTLAVAALVLVAPGRLAGAGLHRRVLLVVAGCVAFGAVLEATIFNIAQFDPVDLCNQSLGAALGGLAIAAGGVAAPLPPRAASGLVGLAALFLIGGFYFAFA